MVSAEYFEFFHKNISRLITVLVLRSSSTFMSYYTLVSICTCNYFVIFFSDFRRPQVCRVVTMRILIHWPLNFQGMHKGVNSGKISTMGHKKMKIVYFWAIFDFKPAPKNSISGCFGRFVGARGAF